MNGAKRYYWLKLHQDFFEDDTMAYLEELPGGAEYVLFYLKLCLRSLQTDGVLMRLVGDQMLPYDAASLARRTRTPVDTVRAAMSLFEKIGIVQVLDSGALCLPQMEEMTGTETDRAIRQRRQRAAERLTGGNSGGTEGGTLPEHCSAEKREERKENKKPEYREREERKKREASSEKRQAAPAGRRRMTPPALAEFCRERWMLSGQGLELLESACKKLGPALTEAIVHNCADNGGRYWAYVRTALEQAMAAGLTDAQDYRMRHERRKNYTVDRSTPSGNAFLRPTSLDELEALFGAEAEESPPVIAVSCPAPHRPASSAAPALF